MLYIVGIGPGHKDYILNVAVKVLNSVDLIIGFHRAIEAINYIDNNKEKVTSLKDILNMININKSKNIAIVASGDPTFFGITDFIKSNYHNELEVITGITSFQYLMAKTKLSWSKAYAGSLHGREADFINKIKENSLSIWLCDNKNTPNYLCSLIANEDTKAEVIIGENLSYEDEKITIGNPEDYINSSFSSLSILVVNRNK